MKPKPPNPEYQNSKNTRHLALISMRASSTSPRPDASQSPRQTSFPFWLRVYGLGGRGFRVEDTRVQVSLEFVKKSCSLGWLSRCGSCSQRAEVVQAVGPGQRGPGL